MSDTPRTYWAIKLATDWETNVRPIDSAWAATQLRLAIKDAQDELAARSAAATKQGGGA